MRETLMFTVERIKLAHFSIQQQARMEQSLKQFNCNSAAHSDGNDDLYWGEKNLFITLQPLQAFLSLFLTSSSSLDRL